jgi:hypothetical protein
MYVKRRDREESEWERFIFVEKFFFHSIEVMSRKRKTRQRGSNNNISSGKPNINQSVEKEIEKEENRKTTKKLTKNQFFCKKDEEREHAKGEKKNRTPTKKQQREKKRTRKFERTRNQRVRKLNQIHE